MPRCAFRRLSAVEYWKSTPSALSVPLCESVVGSRPSAIRALRSVGLFRTLGSMVLLSYSLVTKVDHDVYWFARCRSVACAPDPGDRYPGVKVYHGCPSAPGEKWGWKK